MVKTLRVFSLMRYFIHTHCSHISIKVDSISSYYHDEFRNIAEMLDN